MVESNLLNLLLTKYPKERPVLSEEERALHQKEYLSNRSGEKFLSKTNSKK